MLTYLILAILISLKLRIYLLRKFYFFEGSGTNLKYDLIVFQPFTKNSFASSSDKDGMMIQSSPVTVYYLRLITYVCILASFSTTSIARFSASSGSKRVLSTITFSIFLKPMKVSQSSTYGFCKSKASKPVPSP